MLHRQRMYAGSAIMGLLLNLGWTVSAFTDWSHLWALLMPMITYGIGALMVPKVITKDKKGTSKQPESKEQGPTVRAVESEVWDVLKQLGYQATEAKRVFREASAIHPEMDSEQLVHSILQARGRRQR